MFKSFAQNSEIVKSLMKFGKKVAPLQLIGTFMSYTGNVILNDIWTKYNKKIFYGGHKAVKITKISNSSGKNDSGWLTEVVKVYS